VIPEGIVTAPVVVIDWRRVNPAIGETATAVLGAGNTD
jgi:hypothetical protein